METPNARIVLDILGRPQITIDFPLCLEPSATDCHYSFQSASDVHDYLRARSANNGPSLAFASNRGLPVSLSRAHGMSIIMSARGWFSPNGIFGKMQNWHTILILNKRIEMNSSGRMVPLHPRGL